MSPHAPRDRRNHRKFSWVAVTFVPPSARAVARGLRRFFALAVVSATACGLQAGAFGSDAFHHARNGYDVRYADAARLGIMPPGWRLDNFSQTESGFVAKDEDFYRTIFEFDSNNDQAVDATETVPTFDLRFEHSQTKAIVWLRTLPAPADESHGSVYALASYMDSVAMSGYELARFDDPAAEKQFAVQILETKTAELAAKRALAITFEIAKLSELKVSIQAKRKRAKLVLLRTGNTRRIPAKDLEYPTVLVAGYASPTESFDQKISDFHAFLRQIVLDEHAGYRELAPAQADAE